MDFCLLLSLRSNILLSDLPWCNVMPYKAKMNQERKHKYTCIYTFKRFPTGLTSDLTLARTHTFSF